MNITIRGLQEAQRGNLKMMAAIKPSGGLGRATLYLATQAQRYATAITHVDTGALRASHRVVPQGPARYAIYIDPTGKNPRSGALTSRYGPAEHARGGRHAFYERTVYEAGPRLGTEAVRLLMSELP